MTGSIAVIDQFLKLASPWMGLAGMLATLLVGLLSARVSYRVARPRKRITAGIAYQFASIRKPRSEGFEVPNGVTDEYNHVRLVVRNTGRRAITTTDFEDLPLELHLGAQIVALDAVESRPASQRAVNVSHDLRSDHLNFGPGLLNQGQRIKIDVITASTAELRLLGSLVDVTLGSERYGPVARRWASVAGVCSILCYSYLGKRYVLEEGMFHLAGADLWRVFDITTWRSAYAKNPVETLWCLVFALITGVTMGVYWNSGEDK